MYLHQNIYVQLLVTAVMNSARDMISESNNQNLILPQ